MKVKLLKKLAGPLRLSYTAQFSQLLVSQCRCETSCPRIAQCNMGCRKFLLRKALHEVEISSTFRNRLQQLATPLHSVTPLQQRFSQFYGSFNKGACAHFLFIVTRSLARQVAEKIAQCNRVFKLRLRKRCLPHAQSLASVCTL